MAPLVAALVFVFVVTLVVGLWWVAETRRTVRARLEASGAGFDVEADIVRAHPSGAASAWRVIPSSARVLARLSALSVQAGYTQSATDIALVILAFVAAGGGAAWLRTGRPLWALPAGLIAGALPVAFLAYKRQRRLTRFQTQFPDALDMMTRAIRAGNALTGAIRLVGEEMPDPVGGEFRQAAEEIRLGMEPGEALFRLQTRVPVEDLAFFCTALRIQRATGGNMAEILDRLAEVIRERFKILSYARVLSSQHRGTAICVGLSPLVFGVILLLLQPGYFDALVASELAPTLVGLGLLFEAIGFFAIWRIAKIKV